MPQNRRALIAVLLLAAVTALKATEVSGRWTGTLSPANGQQEAFLLVLQQNGTKLTGTAGANDSDRHPLEEGAIENDRVTFQVAIPNSRLMFDLRVNGDEMNGIMSAKSGERVLDTARVSIKR